MLKLLRSIREARRTALLHVFIDEESEGGHGLMDKLPRALRESTDPELQRKLASAPPTAPRETVPFRDVSPDKPLLVAMYSASTRSSFVEAPAGK